jgi:hypothetical protein
VLKRRSNGTITSSGSKTRDGVVEDSDNAATSIVPNNNNPNIDSTNARHSPQSPQPPITPLQPLNTLESAKHVAAVVDNLDFVGWNGELYVIVRGEGVKRVRVEGENRGVKKVDAAAGTMDTPSSSVTPVPLLTSSSSSTPQPPLPSSSSPHIPQTRNPTPTTTTATIELKELPSRRRLDCAKAVDLGNDDNVWLERRDVPIDYDMPVGGD